MKLPKNTAGASGKQSDAKSKILDEREKNARRGKPDLPVDEGRRQKAEEQNFFLGPYIDPNYEE